MNIQKWNPKKHVYESYEPNPEWKLILLSDDMDELVNCAQCGKKIKFGDSYTSKQIHNPIGLGYPVCESCYEVELKKEVK